MIEEILECGSLAAALFTGETLEPAEEKGSRKSGSKLPHSKGCGSGCFLATRHFFSTAFP